MGLGRLCQRCLMRMDNADVIARLLSHQEKNKVRDSYNRAEYLPQRRKLLQWLGDYLDSIDDTRDKKDIIKKIVN